MSLNSGNHNPAETAKFDLDLDAWWNPNGPLKTLHQINPPRLQFITQYCPLDGQRVLDIGCGGGILAEALAVEATEVVGLDLSPGALAAAQQHAERRQVKNLRYLQQAAEPHAEQYAETYDVITCMELLEHVPEPESIVQAAASLLKPNGWAFFSTINRNLKSYFGAVLTAEYILRFIPKGTHDYGQFIKPSELAAACRRYGLSLQASSGLGYLPGIEKAYLTDSMAINYLIAVRKTQSP